jgi:hypothetical protein
MMEMSPQPRQWREPDKPGGRREPDEPAGSAVRFTARFRSLELEQADFPIEVRTLSAALVKQGVLSEVLTLNPGDYIAITHLPGGQDAQAEFSVPGNGQSLTVQLQLDPSDESPNESQEVQRFVRGTGATPPAHREPMSSFERRLLEAAHRPWDMPWLIIRDDPRVTVAPLERVVMRGFTGNLLKGEIEIVTGSRWWVKSRETKPPGFAEFIVTDPTITGIQIFRSQRRPLNLLMPSARDAPNEPPCRIVIRTLDEGYLAQVHPGDLLADSLLKYAEEGMADAMQTLSRAHAERLLAAKIERPIAATVGAYSLLRTGALEALHDWTSNLYNWMTWLPDAVPILAEHLARQGRHAEALEILVRLPERGLPIFTDGLSYALDRLRLYAGNSGSKFPEERIREGQALLDRLEDFSIGIDFSQPTVSFAGFYPSAPRDQPFYDLKLGEGVDLTGELAAPPSRPGSSEATHVTRHEMQDRGGARRG